MKLQAGEYVSLGKVETELKTCPIVDNICVYAESTKQFCVALVVPNPKHLNDLAFANGISENFEELCKLPAVNKAVVSIIAEHGRKCECDFVLNFEKHPSLCYQIFSSQIS